MARFLHTMVRITDPERSRRRGRPEDVALDEDEMSRALQAIEGLPSRA